MPRQFGRKSDRQTVLISVNPKAGARFGKDVIDDTARWLAERGFHVKILTDIGELTDEAANAHRSGRLHTVVAAGGDGTVGLVANRTAPGMPLAILPLGTENLLARQLSLEADPERVGQTVSDGRLVHIDAGRQGDRLFLLMAGCGFDAEVVRRLHERRTGHIRHLSYAKPILDSIRNYHYPELTVYCDEAADSPAGEIGTRAEGIRGRWAFLVNLPRYAGGLQIAPQACGNDGLLDLCVFRQGSFWSGLRYLLGVWLGWHRHWPDVAVRRVRSVRVVAEEAAPVQLDGDPSGFLPARFDVVPKRIALRVPADHRVTWLVEDD